MSGVCFWIKPLVLRVSGLELLLTVLVLHQHGGYVGKGRQKLASRGHPIDWMHDNRQFFLVEVRQALSEVHDVFRRRFAVVREPRKYLLRRLPPRIHAICGLPRQ